MCSVCAVTSPWGIPVKTLSLKAKLWKFDHSSSRSVGVGTHSFFKWDLSNSVPKYSVKTSAQLSLVPFFRSLISPIPTNSCTYRNRSSTCSVFLLVPNLVAMLFPAVLAVWTLMLIDFASFASVIRLRTSLVPCPMAYSSASDSWAKCYCALCSAAKGNSWVQNLRNCSTSAFPSAPTSCPVWIYIAVQSADWTFKWHVWTEALTVIPSSSNVPQYVFHLSDTFSGWRSKILTVPKWHMRCQV